MSDQLRLKTRLHHHQAQAVRHLARQGGGALLHDPGLGKTLTTITYLAALTKKHGTIDALICVPLAAIDTWPSEFAAHWPDDAGTYEIIVLDRGTGTIEQKAARIAALADEPDHEGLRVVLINHDAFRSRAKAKNTKTVTVQDRMIHAVLRWGPDVGVVDELHRIKSHTSNTGRAFAKMARAIPRRIGLTGTVTPRDPLDLFGQWLWINPQRFGTSWQHFRHRYAQYGGYMGHEVIRFQRLDEMRELLLNDAHIAKKEDALDLPPVTERVVPVRLSAKELRTYNEVANDMISHLEQGTITSPSALTTTLRLRQLTGGHATVETAKGAREVHQIGTSKLDVCADLVQDLVAADEKVVIFAHFRADVAALAERMGKFDVPVFEVTGDTSPKARLAAREEFRDHAGSAIFVAQQRTMSIAVNEFVAAANAIFYSLSERRDDLDQAKDRLNRFGQTRPVTLTFLAVPGSVDEAMIHAHRTKMSLERALTTDRFSPMLLDAALTTRRAA